MNFSESIKAFEKKALLAANRSRSNAIESLFTEVVVLSPEPPGKGGYAKGLVKNSWYASIGLPDLTVGTTPNVNGADSLSRIRSVLAMLPPNSDSVVTLTNSLPYIAYVEYIGWPKNFPGNNTGWQWTGKVGPYSMVSTSITHFIGRYA